MGESKTLALAISAIKNLKEVRGSNSRDIVNYVTKACQIDEDAVRKQVQAALRRGVAYGYLKRSENGCYTFPLETEGAAQEIAAQEIGLIEACARKRGKKSAIKNRRSRKSNLCKRCGKTCPCGNSQSTNRRVKNPDPHPPLGTGAAGKTARLRNADDLFTARSLGDLKDLKLRRRRGKTAY